MIGIRFSEEFATNSKHEGKHLSLINAHIGPNNGCFIVYYSTIRNVWSIFCIYFQQVKPIYLEI